MWILASDADVIMLNRRQTVGVISETKKRIQEAHQKYVLGFLFEIEWVSLCQLFWDSFRLVGVKQFLQ